MSVSIHSIIIGVRTMPTFQMIENAGSIFDKLLKDEKCFSREVFSKVSFGELEKMLYEDDKKEITNYLKITSDNVIYSHKMEKNSDFDTTAEKQKKIFESKIVPVTLDEFKPAIYRLGMVFIADITDDKLKKFREKYFAKDVDPAEFRFSMSNGTNSAAMFTDVGDHINRIYSMSRKESGSIKLSFDYQQHYKPLKPNWTDCKPNSFFENAIKTAKEELLSLT